MTQELQQHDTTQPKNLKCKQIEGDEEIEPKKEEIEHEINIALDKEIAKPSPILCLSKSETEKNDIRTTKSAATTKLLSSETPKTFGASTILGPFSQECVISEEGLKIQSRNTPK